MQSWNCELLWKNQGPPVAGTPERSWNTWWNSLPGRRCSNLIYNNLSNMLILKLLICMTWPINKKSFAARALHHTAQRLLFRGEHAKQVRTHLIQGLPSTFQHGPSAMAPVSSGKIAVGEVGPSKMLDSTLLAWTPISHNGHHSGLCSNNNNETTDSEKLYPAKLALACSSRCVSSWSSWPVTPSLLRRPLRNTHADSKASFKALAQCSPPPPRSSARPSKCS